MGLCGNLAHDASDALSLATGKETVPALGQAPEMSSVELALLELQVTQSYISNKPSQGMQPHPGPKQ